MRITKTVFLCDVCNREVEKESKLKPIVLPYFESDCEGRSYMLSYKPFDVCPTCLEQYGKLIIDNFVEIRDTLGDIKVIKKG